MLPDAVTALIKEREGFEPKAYRDSLGFLTGGWGHKLTPNDPYKRGEAIPQDVLDSWFSHDLLRARLIAQGQAAQIGEPRLIDPLTAVAFQMGTKLQTEFHHAWAALLSHDWQLAANEVEAGGGPGGKSNWYLETPTRVKDFQAALRSLIQPPTNADVIE